jgi:hypothetical protein
MSPRISGLYNSENDGGPAAFTLLAEGRIISPRTGSLAGDPKVGTNLPIQSTELSAESCTHTNAHTNTVHTRAVWLECYNTPNRNVIAEEASQSREKPLRHSGAEYGPLWREIKLLCVVYATRQGTGISCAPQIVPFPCTFPPSPPNADLLLSASVR